MLINIPSPGRLLNRDARDRMGYNGRYHDEANDPDYVYGDSLADEVFDDWSLSFEAARAIAHSITNQIKD